MHKKTQFPIRVQYAAQLYKAALIYFSERQKKMPPVYSISTHADFYLSVYNNNSKMPRSTADPIISLLQPFVWIYSQHDLMSEVLPCVSKQFY